MSNKAPSFTQLSMKPTQPTAVLRRRVFDDTKQKKTPFPMTWSLRLLIMSPKSPYVTETKVSG